MCGIVCVIGKPTNPEVSHALLTSLLEKTEVRGNDATGFWACPEDLEGVIYTKEPTKSTEFVKKNELWKGLNDRKVDLLISHCRKRTYQNGSESINANNHPFISPDNRTALVHNGNVPEFDRLRSEYTVQSDCDSELLLRMLESGDEYDDKYLRKELAKLKIDESGKTIGDLKGDEPLPSWAPRLMGLKDIFTRVNYGAMAVAIGERGDDGSRSLWLFRDKERPLHLVDMRKSLGQIFVCSMPNIWREAVENCEPARALVQPSSPIVEFPAMFVWHISLGADNKFRTHKWKVNKTRRNDTTFERERPSREGIATCHQRKPLAITTNLDIGNNHKVLETAVAKAPEVKKNESNLNPVEAPEELPTLSLDIESESVASSDTTLPGCPVVQEEVSSTPSTCCSSHSFDDDDFEEAVIATVSQRPSIQAGMRCRVKGLDFEIVVNRIEGNLAFYQNKNKEQSIHISSLEPAPTVRILEDPKPTDCCEEGQHIIALQRASDWLEIIDRSAESENIIDTDVTPAKPTPVFNGLKERVATRKKK